MKQPWSKTRQILEQDFLCESLRGRVMYFQTRYHKAHDDGGRVVVIVDKVEKINFPFTNETAGYFTVVERGIDYTNLSRDEYMKLLNEIESELKSKGIFEPWDFFEAVEILFSSDIQDALKSENPVVRMLAILDRRVGKRSLERIKLTVDKQPEWLQFFYRLRLEAEGIKVES
ncbi:MAG: hypothetical protein LBT20_03660 [Clostridiales bacterium]|jgi:hypothetical protein|nr:hypothetical protein [Clostridiales bacterium]